VPLSGEAGPHLTQCGLVRDVGPYLCTKWHLVPFSRLATTDMAGKLWGVPFGGAGSPSTTMSPGPRSTSIPSSILMDPAVWPQQTWAENWEAVPLWDGYLHLTQCGQGLPPYQVASLSIQLFGHNRHGPKIVGCYAPFLGGCGSPCNNVAWANVYICTKWHPDPSSRLGTTDMCQDWGLCPFGGSWVPI